jgi:transposase-like protein
VAQLLPPESSPVDLVSREVGVSVATLERWRAEALENAGGTAGPLGCRLLREMVGKLLSA